MTVIDRLWAPNDIAASALNKLQPFAALAARLYVSWQFLKSGYIKVTSWNGTLYLFENEYHTPLLSPHAAAVAGAFGELFFPALLILGIMGRLSAVGLFTVNVAAVISYANVLLADESAAALGSHVLWGALLLFLIVFGPGRLSVDALLKRSPL